MDEMATQLIGEVRAPLPAEPGKPLRYDTEYKRNGTANIFIAFEPLAGKRQTKVTEQRTQVDWAHFIKELVDQHYPRVEKIRLVMDNLNTNTKASLYEAFAPSEAKRIADKLEIHYTPKHGSWLNLYVSPISHFIPQSTHKQVIIDGNPFQNRKPLGIGTVALPVASRCTDCASLISVAPQHFALTGRRSH